MASAACREIPFVENPYRSLPLRNDDRPDPRPVSRFLKGEIPVLISIPLRQDETDADPVDLVVVIEEALAVA